MVMNYKYASPYVKIYWTKRYINYSVSNIRSILKRLKYKNRVHKRPSLFEINCKINCKRKPYLILQAQRRNYNTAYTLMHIPI